MPTNSSTIRPVIDKSACDLAFHAGQRLEQVILDRAIALASRMSALGGRPVVTGEHVRQTMDEFLPPDFRHQVVDAEEAEDRSGL